MLKELLAGLVALILPLVMLAQLHGARAQNVCSDAVNPSLCSQALAAGYSDTAARSQGVAK